MLPATVGMIQIPAGAVDRIRAAPAGIDVGYVAADAAAAAAGNARVDAVLRIAVRRAHALLAGGTIGRRSAILRTLVTGRPIAGIRNAGNGIAPAPRRTLLHLILFAQSVAADGHARGRAEGGEQSRQVPRQETRVEALGEMLRNRGL